MATSYREDPSSSHTALAGSSSSSNAALAGSSSGRFWDSDAWRSGRWIHDAVTQPPLPPEPDHLIEDDGFGAHEALVLPDPTPVVAASPTRSLATAAVVGVLGVVLVLYAFTAPLLESDFVVERLAQSVLPYSNAELDAATGRHDVRIALDSARVDAARVELNRIQMSEASSAVDLANMFWGVATTDDIPAALTARRTTARTFLLLFALIGLAVVVTGLWSLGRRLRELDRGQVVLQGAVGGIGMLGLGLVLLASVLDPMVGEQIALHGVVAGMLGFGLVWGSAVGSIRTRRDMIVLPLVGICAVTLVAVFVGLLVTL